MIRFEVAGPVATITFDNGRLNILTREMHEFLYRALLRFLRDDALKVGIVTCGANTSFSSGDDLKTADDPFGDAPDWAELVMTMPRSKPMIGAVRGHCLGQGLIYLLLLTDIRYAAPNASFGFPEIKYGMGGAGVAARLSQQIPPTVAMHMVLTGEPLGAEAARECHLLNEVVPDAQLLDKAVSVANRIGAHPLVSLQTELWPGVRQNNLSQHEAIALVSCLWEVQRRSVRTAARSVEGVDANDDPKPDRSRS
jgi:enoyl-CoA hydratase/carnithine racemase